MRPSKHILIVDDEARVLFILSQALKTLDDGLEIAAAHTGRQALAELDEQRFDLLITDLKMPGMGGIELTEAVRSRNEDITVIWVTAYGCYQVRSESQRLDVYRCLDKPLSIGKLRQVALQALEDGLQGHSVGAGVGSGFRHSRDS